MSDRGLGGAERRQEVRGTLFAGAFKGVAGRKPRSGENEVPKGLQRDW